MAMKIKKKIQAIKLRKMGKSYLSIRKKVDVSKSTLSLWLRGVVLNKKQKTKILKGLYKSREMAGQKKTADRLKRTQQIYLKAKEEFNFLIKNPLFITGLALYCAEGDKNILERVKFANSDPHLIAIMMRWYREVCLVKEDKFRIALHIHNLHSNKDVINYWGKITKVSIHQFYKLYVKKTTLKHRKNPLYNGTCSIVINSKDLFRRIMSWKSALFSNFLRESSFNFKIK